MSMIKKVGIYFKCFCMIYNKVICWFYRVYMIMGNEYFFVVKFNYFFSWKIFCKVIVVLYNFKFEIGKFVL